ncbi:hypothetical protein ACFOSC_01070 [Streptantibioticus rubrisoli]|uniref:Uncharacterized protein n=1 Tax=Streptantibioticus rubrisoli TaxID=1387313 RepID=A0ABT1PD39_9ACTN|nr:hypothetical protein [Streptantibioticus rubrisoli]MCQ4043283.1 hypothetical protein [Streptantibioticus rubrisoli]
MRPSPGGHLFSVLAIGSVTPFGCLAKEFVALVLQLRVCDARGDARTQDG